MAREPVIRVVFVDAMTGQEISRTRMPLSRLPQTFEIATTVQIGADAWSIVGAEPPTAAEFAASGRVRLLLARGWLVPSNEILYSLNKPDDFVLALVEFRADGTHDVRYLRRPFQREPDFGVTSVNYDFGELLARAEVPS